MITNERQLQITKAQIERFRQSLAALEAGGGRDDRLHPTIQAAQVDAVRSQLQTLVEQVEDYEQLRSGAVTRIELTSLADLPVGLIKARIGAGLTQRDLGERLGLKEQQIQRYEANRYEGASFGRIVEVANAIGIDVRKTIEILRAMSTKSLLQRLDSAGLDPVFVQCRLAPELAEPANDVEPSTLGRIARTFGWDSATLASPGPLEPPRVAAAAARFKLPKGRDAKSVAAYTAYAHHLAKICAEAMSENEKPRIPVRWKDFRRAVVEAYGDVTLASVVAYAWDLGIVVLPLNDPGTFHGACWRYRGVNVVVLKQATAQPARWLFDLLHEIFHAGQRPELEEFELIEAAETSEERRQSDEERQAMFFAGNVSLNGEAEPLTKAAVQRAGGDLRRLKAAVRDIAEEQRADISLLANYVAFRLSLQGENWWGTAANLQEVTCDPLAVVRDAFFSRFNFEGVDEEGLSLLTLALNDAVAVPTGGRASGKEVTRG